MLTFDNLRLDLDGFALSANFSVGLGSMAAVMGASGAGKSSLLLAIAGFLEPASGRALWQGQDLTDLDPAQRPVSILFQDQNLFPHLTLLQNVMMGLTAGKRPRPADLERARHALAEVGLAGYESRKPAQVSGGQMGRAALARVLLQARPVLLLDEPFSALDADLRAQMLDLVSKLARQTSATVLMVTHDQRDADRFADQIIDVSGGVVHPPQP
jgi:thiamine transport system ATP-binding protein